MSFWNLLILFWIIWAASHRLAYVNKMLENGTGADRQLACLKKQRTWWRWSNI